MQRIALFPGSFDPFTLGHKAVVDRGLELFDRIVVGVGDNSEMRGLLSPHKRVQLIRDVYRQEERVEVTLYDGLTGEYCRKEGIPFILRGMRNAVDFEYERNMELINARLFPEIRTILLCTPAEYAAVSSSIIREILLNQGDASVFLPEGITIENYL